MLINGLVQIRNYGKKWKKFNGSAKSSKAVGFLFDSSNCSSEIAALSNIVKQYSGALYSGSGDPDELIPELLEALDDAGINEVIQAKQEQLDAFLAAK